MVKAFFSPMTLAVMGLFMMAAVVVNASEQKGTQMTKTDKEIAMKKLSNVQSESDNKKDSNTRTEKES